MANDLSTVRSISTGSMISGHLLKKADEISRHQSKKIPAIHERIGIPIQHQNQDFYDDVVKSLSEYSLGASNQYSLSATFKGRIGTISLFLL